MILFKYVKHLLINNTYILLGIVLGVSISYFFDNDCKFNTENKPINYNVPEPLPNTQQTKTVIKTITQKDSDKLIRPHYLSTELSIRDKLFIGVLTSEDKINSQAIYINKTIAHLVDKVKFFITAHNKMKNTFNLSGIVGFTDSRHKYRPFQIIKYIGDTFMHGYDYYFFMNDYNFLNVRRLKGLVERISVSKDVYLGTSIDEGSYCNLDGGILLSNSVVRAIKSNLDWCINNAVSDDSSENLGRCVYYSSKLECQGDIKGLQLPSYKLKHFQLEKHLEQLITRKSFNRAVVVYPVLQAKDFFILNAYFARRRLEKLKIEIDELSKTLTDTWPPGQKVGAKPATRFDIVPQLYFNTTHLFFPDDFTNIRQHTSGDYKDIQKVIEAVKSKVLHQHSSSLQYRRLVNGYRWFDLSRGMDYLVDLGFRDLHTGKEVIKRFQVCKPLGKVEFVAAPYVTENVKVTILLPVQENENTLANDFLDKYERVIMKRREKVLLMLVLVYQYNSTSKGSTDVFGELKHHATKLSSKHRHEDLRVIWVSIRLPLWDQVVTLHNHKVLNFAMVDLALRKIGTDALTLVLDVYSDITTEFLNRVRMNTVNNFQVFSPIPFRQYNPNVTHIDVFDVKKAVGHFDHEEYRYIAFYGKDYVTARKKSQQEVPLIRTDNDIVRIMNTTSSGNVFELFVKYSNNLHCMRATEKDLKVKYHEDGLSGRYNLFFGTKLQLAKLILDYQNRMDVIYK
ncbi:hypothetical protein RN001_010451 [Aquatica leii]|uniref:Hexosyltransferase n=1 Tax=Aquatica leii TaxID=1421715 RepID=A0AAN7P0Z0_9COLE|nr:hypothetical protein RN001_010451 [Aquatica leii]